MQWRKNRNSYKIQLPKRKYLKSVSFLSKCTQFLSITDKSEWSALRRTTTNWEQISTTPYYTFPHTTSSELKGENMGLCFFPAVRNQKLFYFPPKLMLHQSALWASFGWDLISKPFQNENSPNTAHQFD